MGSQLGRRVVHFANLPIKLAMPTTFTNIREISLKTIPSASKIEIKRVLESLYGFEVAKVHTVNYEGKKKKQGGVCITQPGYKKAYVTLRNPLSVNPNLFPIPVIEEERKKNNKESEFSSPGQGEVKSHWLDDKKEEEFQQFRTRKQKIHMKPIHPKREPVPLEQAKFPWSSMKRTG